MKKRVIKRKKLIRVHKKNRFAGRAVTVAAALCLLMGGAMPTNAQESYHRHTGSASEGGGCYQQEIPHIHQGNEATGGACYGTPIIHTHQGNENEQGGCYTTPVGHTHQGSEQQAGECYREIIHSHSAECYGQEECTITNTKNAVIDTYSDSCFSHGQTTHERADITESHSKCGIGSQNAIMEYCPLCGFKTTLFHKFQSLICGKEEGEVIGYESICGHEEGAVEKYQRSCGHEEGSVTGYAKTCNKVIDGYKLSCGMSESSPSPQPTSSPSGNGETTPKPNEDEKKSSEDTSETAKYEAPTLVPQPLIEESDDGGVKTISKKRQEVRSTPSATPMSSPGIRVIKEKKTVVLEEKEAMAPVQEVKEVMPDEKSAFWTPAVQVITIAVSTLLLLTGILLLLLYIRRSVGVYNDDGNGSFTYLGRALVRLEQDGYAITISERMIERSYTNRYRIRPGLFRLGKKEGDELLVYKDNRRIGVYISTYMIVVM